MKKNTYLGLALTACMSVASTSLLAEVLPDPEHSANISAPAESTASHIESAALHMEKAAHHKAMAEHYKLLMATEYEKGEHAALLKYHEAMAAHHEAKSKEHQRAAGEIHATMVKHQ